MNIQDILIKPVTTENSMKAIAQGNRYTFLVNTKASKPEIRNAVQTLFGVEVEAIHTVIMKGGTRRIMGRKIAYTTDANWKKAVIAVKTGQSIDIFETGESKEKQKSKGEKRKKK